MYLRLVYVIWCLSTTYLSTIYLPIQLTICVSILLSVETKLEMKSYMYIHIHNTLQIHIHIYLCIHIEMSIDLIATVMMHHAFVISNTLGLLLEEVPHVIAALKSPQPWYSPVAHNAGTREPAKEQHSKP